MPLRAGTRLGPYTIEAPLGAGGMGEVYRAHDPRLSRQVAIKLLPTATAADPGARARLRSEALAAAALDHPFICKVFEIGEHGDALFVAMEYVAGETLDARLRRGPLPPAVAMRIATEMADALETAHARVRRSRAADRFQPRGRLDRSWRQAEGPRLSRARL